MDFTKVTIFKPTELETPCECCPNIGMVMKYKTFLMCQSCFDKEKKAESETYTPEATQNRVNELDRAIAEARQLDNSIQVRTDLFNAATQSIVELKATIDANESITNKPYALAEELKNRFTHFKQVIFDLNQELVEAGNEQKAIQVYLNNLSNQLRAEEREKLQLANINYQPKPPSKPKSVRVSKGKLDKAELAKYSKELGISEFTLQMVCVQKGIPVDKAADMLRRSIAESKSL